MAVAASACGAAPARVPSAGGGSAPSVPLAFSACMRTHGLPDFPDASGGGPMTRRTVNGRLTIDGVALKEDSAQLQTAAQACRRYLAAGSGGRQPGPQAQRAAEAYAECMRAHGVAAFPDPTFDHGITFNAPPGFDPNAPDVQTANRACRTLMPRPLGGLR